MKNKPYLIVFLFIQFFFNAQITQLSYDKILNYTIKEDNNFKVYSSKSETGNLIIGYGENWETTYIKDFTWQYKKNILNGYLMNDKYLHQNGSSLSNDYLDVVLIKNSNRYNVGSFKNCIAYNGSFKENKTGNNFMIYCLQMDDDYDYSEMNRFLFTTQFGINLENLPQNNIVVKVVLVDKNGEATVNFLDLIDTVNETQKLYFNKDYIEAYINQKPSPKDKKTAPFYCKFIIEEAYLSNEVEKRLNQFMNEMAIYYNEYGYLDIDDQNKFYDSEIQRLATFYKKHNHLDSKQIEKFTSTLKKLKTSKKEEDFFWVRDAY